MCVGSAVEALEDRLAPNNPLASTERHSRQPPAVGMEAKGVEDTPHRRLLPPVRLEFRNRRSSPHSDGGPLDEHPCKEPQKVPTLQRS